MLAAAEKAGRSLSFSRLAVLLVASVLTLLTLFVAVFALLPVGAKQPDARATPLSVAPSPVAALPTEAAVPPTPTEVRPTAEPLLPVVSLAVTPPPIPLKPGAKQDDWQLTFADEFDGPGLNTSYWNTSFWWGRTRDAELQYYVDHAVSVEDGVLGLRADARPEGGREYTSGVVTTQGKFSQAYGFFEMRARIPHGNGLWPAFWLLPEAGNSTVWPPEVDIMEFMGGRPGTAVMNYHYANATTVHGQAAKDYVGPDFSKDFHVFGLEWTRKEMTWYIDGVPRYQVRQNITSLPMYLIVDLAIGDRGG